MVSFPFFHNRESTPSLSDVQKKSPEEGMFPRGWLCRIFWVRGGSAHCHHAADIGRIDTSQDIPHVGVIDHAGIDGVILFVCAEKDFTHGLESSDGTGEATRSRVITVPRNQVERDMVMFMDGDEIGRSGTVYCTSPFTETSGNGTDHAVTVTCDAECCQRVVFRVNSENRGSVFIRHCFHRFILPLLDPSGGMLNGKEPVSTRSLEYLVVEVSLDAGAGAIPVVEADPSGKLDGDIIKVCDEPFDILLERPIMP